MLTPELKKGSAECLVLSLLRHEARHGYELSKLIESRSGPDWRAEIRSQLASLHLRPEREAEITEELSRHLNDKFADLCARTPDVDDPHELGDSSSGTGTSPSLCAILEPTPTPMES